MLKDPIIEEIHRIRDEWAAAFQYDLRALCEDLKWQEKRGLKYQIQTSITIRYRSLDVSLETFLT